MTSAAIKNDYQFKLIHFMELIFYSVVLLLEF